MTNETTKRKKDLTHKKKKSKELLTRLYNLDSGNFIVIYFENFRLKEGRVIKI